MKGKLIRDAGLDSYLDVLSREVKVPHTPPTPTVVNCLQTNQLSEWTLTVTEIDGLADISLTVTLTQQNTEYVYKQPLNRGGGWSLQGWGAVKIEAEAINNATGKIQLSLQPETAILPYVMVAGATTFQTLPGAGIFTPINNITNVTPAGYAPPFTKFVSLKPSGATTIRFVDPAGNIVWQSPALAATDVYWYEIRIFPWLKMEIAGSLPAQTLTTLFYN